MSIHYSLLPRREDPRAENPRWLVYAAAQSTETVNLKQIAHHLSSHNSVFSEGVIIGLLTDFEKCVVEQLKRGARVDLGELGAFYTTLRGRGAASVEEFSTDLIDSINVRWRPSKDMTNSLKRTKLVQVTNRATQRKTKKKAFQELNEEVGASHQ